VRSMASEWKTYRTRFLIKARQLDGALTFVDAIGREHSGQKGDYLVRSSDGSQRIAPVKFSRTSTSPWPSQGILARAGPAR